MQQTVKEHVGSTSYLMLTRTNYTEWAILMRFKMQAQGIWDPVEHDIEFDWERNALAAML